MKRYAKFRYAAPFCIRVILEKPQGGQNDPPPGRRLINDTLDVNSAKIAWSLCTTQYRFFNTRTGGGSENHTDWRGGHIIPPIDLSSYES